MHGMRRCLLLPLFLAGCTPAAEAPGKVEKPGEGTWLAKVRTGEWSFIQDTLQILSAGTGSAHRLEYTIRQLEGSTTLDSTMQDFGAKPITWEVVPGPLNNDLCITGQTGTEPQCGPLNVVSDSVFNLGNFVYRRLGKPTAAQP